nr:glycoside hydrolase family 2 protein [Prolixibacteraceae bacterium]
MRNIFVFVLLILAFAACNVPQSKIPFEKTIDQNWEFAKVGTNDWMPAKVPGTVHADLLANGKINDPHYRLNENDVQWVEDEAWEYRTRFFVDKKVLQNSRVVLHFEGLDTYAKVFLNDSLILESDNMFVGHYIDVKNSLFKGSNSLRVVFDSPVKRGMEKLIKIDYVIPAVNEQAPYNERTNVFTRKAPFHYGWDWGPRLVTSGIWRNVKMLAYNEANIDDVFVQTEKIKNKTAYLNALASVYVEKAGNYDFSLKTDGSILWEKNGVQLKKGLNVIDHNFVIEQAQLWWTNGLGDQHLYPFTFVLSNDEGIVDEFYIDFGIRTLKLVQEPDEVGRSFYFELNGRPVFMKGANVIPSNTLTPSVSNETYKRLIKDAVMANMNMLRVWGGAIYENDTFYELCDKNGILVWQDFMFACALQPGDIAHLENIKSEAEYNVKRLRNYASLAMWCGNNENLHGWHHWGWKEMYEPNVRDFMWNTYDTIFHHILRDAVNEFAPNTPYWSSSPTAYVDELADRQSGDEHDWTIWFGQRPFSDFGVNVPRFVSEYGLQSFPSMHTIKEFAVEADFDINSEVMDHRQRGRMEYMGPGFNGNHLINRYMEQYYNVPQKFEHFTYVSQLLQAKAYQTALESHRKNMPHCMGSLYWQLNDSWPTISWSTVDYYGRWKASHYAVQKANAPIIIAPQYSNRVLKIHVVNDGRNQLNDAKLSLTFIDFDGNELSSL